MTVSCKKKPCLEQYQMAMRPNESEPESKAAPQQHSTLAPWKTLLSSWCSKFIPKQSRRVMWLSMPSTWIRNLRFRVRKMAPQQFKRARWFNKVLSILSLPGKIFSRSSGVTFKDIQSALDNSHFNEKSKRHQD